VKAAFSCVVDAKPKFEWQGFLWAASLLRSAACSAADLRVHHVRGVSDRFLALMRELQVACVEIEPFPGHPYCNKIQQCFSPAFRDDDVVILTDADLFFVAAPSLPFDVRFAGKIVDLPNPPIRVLDGIYRARGVRPPARVPASCALSRKEATFASNLNGGLYVIPKPLLPTLGERWRENALWLLDHDYATSDFGVHVDQVAMALSLDELQVAVTPLDARVNCPIHLPADRLKCVNLPDIAVLHYHALLTPGGDELRETGLPNIDQAIRHANRDIAHILAVARTEPTFENWHEAMLAGFRSRIP
jgi:hypothetical protein